MDTVLVRRICNQHTIDDLMHRITHQGRMLYVRDHCCEANKTSLSLGDLKVTHELLTCERDNTKKGLLPCQGCNNSSIYRDQNATLIDWD